MINEKDVYFPPNLFLSLAFFFGGQPFEQGRFIELFLLRSRHIFCPAYATALKKYGSLDFFQIAFIQTQILSLIRNVHECQVLD